MKLNKKIFVISILFLFILLLLNFNDVFALTYDGQLPSLPNGLCSYYCIYYYDNDTYLIDTNRSNFFDVRRWFWCLGNFFRTYLQN